GRAVREILHHSWIGPSGPVRAWEPGRPSVTPWRALAATEGALLYGLNRALQESPSFFPNWHLDSLSHDLQDHTLCVGLNSVAKLQLKFFTANILGSSPGAAADCRAWLRRRCTQPRWLCLHPQSTHRRSQR